jgi:TolB-like protein/Tfp pilus assembly protein PilF
MTDGTIVRFLKELRRRRVFRVAGLYVVAVWVSMQAADIVFPAWDIPDAAIRFLIGAALVGFPVALVFGWVFDITADGIRRTQPAASAAELRQSQPLRRADYLILAAFLLVSGAIVYETTGRVIGVASLAEAPPAAAVEVEPNSIAVMPFASLSADAEHEFFAFGVAEEILDRLSAFHELKVIARNSSFAFKDSGFDIARISTLLSVRYLLQGSVRRDGPRLRIAARLVDNTGRQVWSDSFDRDIGAIFAVQDEIAETVANSILPHIVVLPPVERLPDIEAYQEFVIGRELMARRATGWFFKVPAHFDRAIELDPEFAEAYAARAIMAMLGAGFVEMSQDRVPQDIEQALALKPGLATAHAAQALLMQHEDPYGYAAREVVLRRALALDPNHIDALNWLANALVGQGRRAEAQELQERAVRIDPLAPAINANLATEELRTGRIDDAERRLQRLLAAPEPSMLTYLSLIDLYWVTGRLVEALEMSKRFLLSTIPRAGRIAPGFALVESYAKLGLQAQAEHWAQRWNDSWPEPHPVVRYTFLVLELMAGHRGYEAAMEKARAMMAEDGLELSAAPPPVKLTFGMVQALAGDHEGAIRTLGALTDSEWNNWPQAIELNARHCLAWAQLHAGASDASRAGLEAIDERLREQQAAGRLHRSDELFALARNALLLGDRQDALELLGQAADAGWRGSLSVANDPRWDALRDEPRFEAIMASVRSELASQRARAEAIDAADDFEGHVDAALAQYRRDQAARQDVPAQSR